MNMEIDTYIAVPINNNIKMTIRMHVHADVMIDTNTNLIMDPPAPYKHTAAKVIC